MSPLLKIPGSNQINLLSEKGFIAWRGFIGHHHYWVSSFGSSQLLLQPLNCIMMLCPAALPFIWGTCHILQRKLCVFLSTIGVGAQWREGPCPRTPKGQIHPYEYWVKWKDQGSGVRASPVLWETKVQGRTALICSPCEAYNSGDSLDYTRLA